MTFEQNLINLVAEYELLYDPNHPLYARVPSRTAAWEEIGQKLNSDRETCKKRWRNLRDTYRRLLQKIHDAGGVYRFRRHKWQYLSLISFLNKFEPLAPAEGTANWPIFIDTSVDAFTRDAVTGENLPVAKLNTGATIDSNERPEGSFVLNEYDTDQVDDETNKKVVELTHSYAKSDNQEAEQKDPEYQIEMYTDGETMHEDFAAGPCCNYLAMLGAKVDSLPVPLDVRSNLEGRITDLVNEVISQYDDEPNNQFG